MKCARLLTIAALAAPLLAACDGSGRALGTATSIIVLADDSVWTEIGDSVYAALEPRIYTVRNERTFEVTNISPKDPKWHELKEFRQVVAIGSADDAWVQPILDEAGDGTGGAVVTARDVWAREQLAIAVVTPPSATAQSALPHLDRVGEVIDSLFRIHVVQRMYTSDADTTLRNALRETYGFSVLLPNVYAPSEREEDNVLLYRNETTVGGDLARSVLMTWRDGVTEPSVEAALAWRDSLAGTVYNPVQRTLRDVIQQDDVSGSGMTGIEVQGAWEGTDPAWPMGGPFITRMIVCQDQDRTYLVDTWLYAPGPRRSKYEYLIQLQTILSTFECA